MFKETLKGVLARNDKVVCSDDWLWIL